MDILDIAGRTRLFGAPKDWNAERDGPCGGLPVRDEPYAPGINKMISEWKLNEIELEHLKLGAPIQLGVIGTVHPVVSLGVGAVPPREREEPVAIDHPPPGKDLAGQGEPLAAWIRRAIMANLKGEADGVDEAVAVIVSNLKASAPDLAGQGEPVAWAYEERGFDFKWHPIVSMSDPGELPWVRNIRPLFAAPAPSRPADWGLGFEAVPDFASAVATAVMGLGWAIPDYTGDEEADAEEQCRRHGMIQDAVAATLRDAPRNGGDGWRPMAEAPKDGKTQIVARHKPNEHTPDGWVATITIDHDDPDEYRRGGLDTIKHYNGEALMSGFHGVWTGWMYPHEVGRGVSAPPSPNAGDGTQEDHR